MPHDKCHKENTQRTFANTWWQADSKEVDFAIEQVLQIVDEWQQHMTTWKVELLFWLTIFLKVDAVSIEVALHSFKQVGFVG